MIGRRPSPALIISILALFVALGSGAYAITAAKDSVTSKSIKKGAVRTVDVKDQNLTGTDVKDNSLLGSDIDESTLQAVQGPPGPEGPRGLEGPPGPFSEVLPSGETLRGIYGTRFKAVAPGDESMATISFGFTLASAPASHFITGGAVPQCPGNALNPQALPGHLCIYESSGSNRAQPAVFDVNFSSTTIVSPFGAKIVIASLAAGTAGSSGSWAVTAP